MPDQATYDALLKALTGSETLGQYPDTLVDRLDAALEAAWDWSAGMNLSIPDLTGPEAGPFMGADTYAHAIEDQVLARYPGPPNKPRTLVEKARTLEALIAGIKAKVETPAPGGGDNPGTLPPGTSQGTLEWAADLSKNDVISAGFKSTDWNTQNGPSWPPPIGTYAGERAIKFQLGSNGKRIEVEPNHRTFGSSGNAWFGFQFYLESDFPLSAGSWHVIWQLHGNDTTSPRFALQAHKGGMTVGDNGAFTSLQKQHWYQCVVYADFSAGRISVWLDGNKVIDNYNCGKSNPDYYLKVGSYQDPSVGAGTIYQRGHRLGSGYGSVVAPFDSSGGGDTPAPGDGLPTGTQSYQSTSALPYGSFKVPGGWIATQGCWGDSAAQTIETTGPNGFRVSKSSHNKPGGVAAYPSVWAGSAWADGSGRDGWQSTRVSDLAGLKTSASITLPSGSWKGNAGAYDLWFDQDPGSTDGLEMMIWMHAENVSPAGSKVGALSNGGASWDVWSGTVGGTPVLSYVRSSSTTSLSNLPIKPFMDDAISRGRLGSSWYLTSPQIGAELWVGGAGFALNAWSFAVA